MQTYKVMNVGSKIESHVTKKQLFDRYGKETGTEDVIVKYVTVHVTDGSSWEGKLTDFVWLAPPDSVDVGDLVTGFDQGGYLRSVNIVRGKNAIVVPAPASTAPMEPLQIPETPQEEPWRFNVASGYAFGNIDIAAFAQAFFRLEQKHKNLADAFVKYTKEHP